MGRPTATPDSPGSIAGGEGRAPAVPVPAGRPAAPADASGSRGGLLGAGVAQPPSSSFSEACTALATRHCDGDGGAAASKALYSSVTGASGSSGSGSWGLLVDGIAEEEPAGPSSSSSGRSRGAQQQLGGGSAGSPAEADSLSAASEHRAPARSKARGVPIVVGFSVGPEPPSLGSPSPHGFGSYYDESHGPPSSGSAGGPGSSGPASALGAASPLARLLRASAENLAALDASSTATGGAEPPFSVAWSPRLGSGGGSGAHGVSPAAAAATTPLLISHAWRRAPGLAPPSAAGHHVGSPSATAAAVPIPPRSLSRTQLDGGHGEAREANRDDAEADASGRGGPSSGGDEPSGDALAIGAASAPVAGTTAGRPQLRVLSLSGRAIDGDDEEEEEEGRGAAARLPAPMAVCSSDPAPASLLSIDCLTPSPSPSPSEASGCELSTVAAARSMLLRGPSPPEGAHWSVPAQQLRSRPPSPLGPSYLAAHLSSSYGGGGGHGAHTGSSGYYVAGSSYSGGSASSSSPYAAAALGWPPRRSLGSAEAAAAPAGPGGTAGLGGGLGGSRARPLVGSFEESLFSGRLTASAGGGAGSLSGFVAVLIVAGVDFAMVKRRLPFSAQYSQRPHEPPGPYVACIDLDDQLPGGTPAAGPSRGARGCSRSPSLSPLAAPGALAGVTPPGIQLLTPSPRPVLSPRSASSPTAGTSGGSSGASAASHRLRVPLCGRIQLVLSNPEATPAHTFAVSYDLRDMPPGTRTFLRQKLIGQPPRGRPGADMGAAGSPLPARRLSLDEATSPGAAGRTGGAGAGSAHSGVLRAGIHLRFVCPPLRPASSRASAGGLGGPLPPPSPERLGRKRLYLCGPLRVVFPQRWLDDAEAESVSVEEEYPGEAEGRYFDLD